MIQYVSFTQVQCGQSCNTYLVFGALGHIAVNLKFPLEGLGH